MDLCFCALLLFCDEKEGKSSNCASHHDCASGHNGADIVGTGMGEFVGAVVINGNFCFVVVLNVEGFDYNRLGEKRHAVIRFNLDDSVLKQGVEVGEMGNTICCGDKTAVLEVCRVAATFYYIRRGRIGYRGPCAAIFTPFKTEFYAGDGNVIILSTWYHYRNLKEKLSRFVYEGRKNTTFLTNSYAFCLLVITEFELFS